MASRALSKNRIIPKKRKNTPKPVNPIPISVQTQRQHIQTSVWNMILPRFLTRHISSGIKVTAQYLSDDEDSSQLCENLSVCVCLRPRHDASHSFKLASYLHPSHPPVPIWIRTAKPEINTIKVHSLCESVKEIIFVLSELASVWTEIKAKRRTVIILASATSSGNT